MAKRVSSLGNVRVAPTEGITQRNGILLRQRLVIKARAVLIKDALDALSIP